MAKRLTGFDFGGPTPARRYDWQNWTDGSPWEIVRGEDYDVPTEHMRGNLHGRANQLALKVRTTVVRRDGHESLRFQFYGARKSAAAVKSTGGSDAKTLTPRELRARAVQEVEERFARKIGEAVERRAAAVRQQQDSTTEIAALAVDARSQGVTMDRLAELIKVYIPKTGELRSVSRQTVDNMVADFEGRLRQPRPRRRPRPDDGHRAGGVKREAFEDS